MLMILRVIVVWCGGGGDEVLTKHHVMGHPRGQQPAVAMGNNLLLVNAT